MSDTVILRREGPALTIQINRPADFNRIDSECLTAITAALDAADADPSVRVIVLAGDAQSFCCGGRIDGHPNGTVMQQLGFGKAFCELQHRMSLTHAPIIAAVEGDCVAGGMSLLQACDLAIASTKAEFAFPEINFGLFPVLAMAVAHQGLPQKVAFDLFYTGRRIKADEAHRLNLVNDVAAPGEFQAAVQRRVDELSGKSFEALAIGRKAYYAMAPMVPAARLDYAQGMLTALLASSKGAVPVAQKS